MLYKNETHLKLMKSNKDQYLLKFVIFEKLILKRMIKSIFYWRKLVNTYKKVILAVVIKINFKISEGLKHG